MQERCHESGSCVQKNCAILGVHPNHLGTTSVQLRARFQEREPVSDAQQSIWSLSLLFWEFGLYSGPTEAERSLFPSCRDSFTAEANDLLERLELPLIEPKATVVLLPIKKAAQGTS